MPVPDDPMEFTFVEKSVAMPNGSVWKLRELGVQENDECADMARKPDGIVDARAMMRFILVKSITDPVITLDQLVKLPNRAYLRLADAANDLNAADDEETPAGEG
jgi:hypothetical protein